MTLWGGGDTLGKGVDNGGRSDILGEGQGGGLTPKGGGLTPKGVTLEGGAGGRGSAGGSGVAWPRACAGSAGMWGGGGRHKPNGAGGGRGAPHVTLGLGGVMMMRRGCWGGRGAVMGGVPVPGVSGSHS